MRRTFFAPMPMPAPALVVALALAATAPAVAAAAEQPPPAAAKEGGDGAGSWSIFSAAPVGRGRLGLLFQAGWPDISLGGHLGYTDRADLGARVAFTWGQDGVLFYGPGVVPGLRIQASVRYVLLTSGAITLGATFAPGFGIDYLPGLTTPRILLPLGLILGFQASSALVLHGAVELPAYVTPAAFGGLTLPILFGGGAEYRLSQSAAVTGLLRMGPSVDLGRTGAPARFAFGLAVGLAFRT